MKDRRSTERGRLEDLEQRVRRTVGLLSTSAVGSVTVTLDAAYNGGRSVTVDAGPIVLIGTSDVIGCRQSADTEYRFRFESDGTLGWGPGGVDGTDCTLFRSGQQIGVGELTVNGHIIGSYTLRANSILSDTTLSAVTAATGNETVSISVPINVASAAGTVWDGAHFKGSTATLTGGVNVTTATGLNQVTIERSTITSVSATTVTNAATLAVINQPAAGGSVTITNSYALWVQAGLSRFDGNLVIGAAAVADSANLYVTGKLSTSGEVEINGALNHDGTTVGLFGVTPAVRPSAYTITNGTLDRAYDANATTLDELADVVYTMWSDLTSLGIFQ